MGWKTLWERVASAIRWPISVKAKVRISGLKYCDPATGEATVADWDVLWWNPQGRCYQRIDIIDRHTAFKGRPLSFDIGWGRPASVAHRAHRRAREWELFKGRMSFIALRSPASERDWRVRIILMCLCTLAMLAVFAWKIAGGGVYSGLGRDAFIMCCFVLVSLSPYFWMLADARPATTSVGIAAGELVLVWVDGRAERIPWSAIRSVRSSGAGLAWLMVFFDGRQLRLPKQGLTTLRLIQAKYFPEDELRDRMRRRTSVRRAAVLGTLLAGAGVFACVSVVNWINASAVPALPGGSVGLSQVAPGFLGIVALAAALWWAGEREWRSFVRSRAGRRAGI